MSFRKFVWMVLGAFLLLSCEKTFAADPGSFEEGTRALSDVKSDMMKSGAVNASETKQIEFRDKVIIVEYPKGKFREVVIKVPVIQTRSEGEKFKGESLPPAKTALQLWLEQRSQGNEKPRVPQDPPASSTGKP